MSKYTISLTSFEPYYYVELVCYAYDINDADKAGEHLAAKLGLHFDRAIKQ